MNPELIVLDLDGGELLTRCLRSIAGQTEKPSRVIVVDNGSRAPVAERIGSWPFEVRLLRSEENLGFTGGTNLAMDLVQSAYVGWINNDVELDPRWLADLRRALDEDPRLAAVQPVILSPDGTIDGAGISIDSGRFVQVARGEARTDAPAWGVSATATLYRTGALRESGIGGAVLHPAFFAYYEDVELSARLLANGWRLRVLDLPLATHLGSGSEGRLGGRTIALRTRNRYRVARLHPGVGSISALLFEDLRGLAGDVISLRFGAAAKRTGGVVAGLFASPAAK